MTAEQKKNVRIIAEKVMGWTYSTHNEELMGVDKSPVIVTDDTIIPLSSFNPYDSDNDLMAAKIAFINKFQPWEFKVEYGGLKGCKKTGVVHIELTKLVLAENWEHTHYHSYIFGGVKDYTAQKERTAVIECMVKAVKKEKI